MPAGFWSGRVASERAVMDTRFLFLCIGGGSMAGRTFHALSQLSLQVPRMIHCQSCAGIQPKHEEETIENIARILREHRNRQRWNFLKKSYPKGLSAEQVSKAMMRIKNQAHLALRFFDWAAQQKGFCHSLESYCTIAHIAARSRLTAAAQSLMQKVVIEESKHDENQQNLAAFRALARSYRPCDSCPAVFDMLIKAYIRARRIDQAVAVFMQLKKHAANLVSVGTCNMLLDSVATLKRSEDCQDLYNEMLDSRIMPNANTCNILLRIHCMSKRFDDAETLLADMEEKSLTNLTSYNVVLDALCSQGRTDVAEVLWDRMLQNGMDPDICSYNARISGFCRNNEVQEAEACLNKIIDVGLSPNSTTYCLLISAYCDLGNAQKSLALCQEMIKHDLMPDAGMVKRVVKVLCLNGKVELAQQLLRKIPETFLTRDRSIYTDLICGYCLLGDVEAAIVLQNEMAAKGFQPDAQIYSAFIRAFYRKGEIARAHKVLEEALEIGLVMERSCYEPLIDALKTSGSLDDANKLSQRILDT